MAWGLLKLKGFDSTRCDHYHQQSYILGVSWVHGNRSPQKFKVELFAALLFARVRVPARGTADFFSSLVCSRLLIMK